MNDQTGRVDGQLAVTARTRGRRLHERVRHSLDEIIAVLDASPIAHVGYVHEGSAFVTPTFHWVAGDSVYWHGSSASRALRAAEVGEVCLTVTTLDAYVLARSAFHHSANYRSAMVFGRPRKLISDEEKRAALRHFLDRRFPDRWDQLRDIYPQELKATTILSLPITEASVKTRTGPPKDDAEDMAAPVWAGIIPIVQQFGQPEPDGDPLDAALPVLRP